jgi:uncharacterized protein YjiS (DUF1127 family)
MNAPLAKEQIALLMSDNLTYRASPVQGAGVTAQAARPSALSALLSGVTGAVRFMAELPRRRAVIDELSRLSDRELADIGLNRSELKLVFARARA